ncbi:hypothetical protein [Escherichia phage dw-ec]|nr:hypothetical protein [Escherichia phage dw-ec]
MLVRSHSATNKRLAMLSIGTSISTLQALIYTSSIFAPSVCAIRATAPAYSSLISITILHLKVIYLACILQGDHTLGQEISPHFVHV